MQSWAWANATAAVCADQPPSLSPPNLNLYLTPFPRITTHTPPQPTTVPFDPSAAAMQAAEDELLVLWSAVEKDKAAVMDRRNQLMAARGLSNSSRQQQGVRFEANAAAKERESSPPSSSSSAAAAAAATAAAAAAAAGERGGAAHNGNPGATISSSSGLNSGKAAWEQVRRQLDSDDECGDEVEGRSAAAAGSGDRAAAAAASFDQSTEGWWEHSLGARYSRFWSRGRGLPVPSSTAAEGGGGGGGDRVTGQRQAGGLGATDRSSHPAGTAFNSSGWVTAGDSGGSSGGGGEEPGRERTLLHTLWFMLVDVAAVARGPERRALALAAGLAFFDQVGGVRHVDASGLCGFFFFLSLGESGPAGQGTGRPVAEPTLLSLNPPRDETQKNATKMHQKRNQNCNQNATRPLPAPPSSTTAPSSSNPAWASPLPAPPSSRRS